VNEVRDRNLQFCLLDRIKRDSGLRKSLTEQWLKLSFEFIQGRIESIKPAAKFGSVARHGGQQKEMRPVCEPEVAAPPSQPLVGHCFKQQIDLAIV
jgi:hypothetical protein